MTTEAGAPGGAGRSSWPRALRTASALGPYTLWTIGPVLWLVPACLRKLAGDGLQGLFGWRAFALLGHSLALAWTVSILATLLGTGVALWLASRRSRAGTFARLAFPLPFFLPPCVYAASWEAISPVGLSRFGFPAFSGFVGSTWILGFMLAPVVSLLVLWTLESLPPELSEAAALLGGGTRAWKEILLPLLWPAIVAGGGLVFALALADYTVPSLMQFSVYSMEIHAEFSQSADAARAAWLSLPLVLLTSGVVGITQWKIRRAPVQDERGKLGLPAMPAPLSFVSSVAAALACAGVFLPLLVIAWKAVGRGPGIGGTLWADLADTLFVASGAGLLCLAGAWPVAKWLAQHRSAGAWFLAVAPLAIPAPLYGVAVASLASLCLPLSFVDTPLFLSAAHAGRFMPVAIVAMAAQFARTDPTLLDAARLCPAGRLVTLWRIILPLRWAGVAAGFGVAFTLSLGEIGSTVILIPPGLCSLAVTLYNLLHYGASEAVASLALFQAGLVIATGSLLVWAVRRAA